MAISILNLQFNDNFVMSVLFTVFPCKIIGENINTCPKSINNDVTFKKYDYRKNFKKKIKKSLTLLR